MPNELDLIPPFVEGEIVTIQRTVNGKNVLMVVTIQDPCALSADGTTKKPVARVTVNGWAKNWGESSYADARVERQRQSIDRLLTHLTAHCKEPDCPHIVLSEED